ncbi:MULTISPECIES: hypothetical protein [Klebsiella pneumoniae complex]|uniref:hypothetical protein n=1 Tax=Klebsiella pneumoniae complex TaxID=3390273 RepID=UPI0007CCD4AF|nr:MULTISPECIES: hypothetical protein [Klebsiella]SBH92301.1 Uncharacterised protein [Klebsiella pneumoniae]HBQ9084911.1 hypothetical protein [Klebsiella quasipneumoniae]HBQ9091127.1 hypothetical protein [Klebsiella quasipneumoniae]HBQ9096418.1 hypothetical protein [Klebsiella quasipneumoniae]HBQ9112772.1 hypothetical protein [Klebsiella quasipneumoniae]
MKNKTELTTALATIDKCPGLSGSPVGEELQDCVKQLVAENLALKIVPEIDSVAMLLALDSFRSESLPDVGLQKAFESLMYHRKIPVTDRIVTGIKAETANQMCEAFVKHKDLAGLSNDDLVTVRKATDALLHCAEQLPDRNIDSALFDGVVQLQRNADDKQIPDGYVLVPKELSAQQLRDFQIKTQIGAYVTANWSCAYDALSEMWAVVIASTKQQF